MKLAITIAGNWGEKSTLACQQILSQSDSKVLIVIHNKQTQLSSDLLPQYKLTLQMISQMVAFKRSSFGMWAVLNCHITFHNNDQV